MLKLKKNSQQAKRNILKALADKIEGFRDNLDKDSSSDFGFLANNINIRHNNLDGKNKKEYLVNIENEELESWYDETYQVMLLCILENNYKVTKITCGSHHEFCPRRKCKFWGGCQRKARPVEDQVPHSVYRPRYEQDWGPSLPPPPPAKVNCDNGRKHGDNKPCPMPDPMAPYFDAENKMRYESVKQSHKRHNKKVDAPKRKRNRFV